MSISIDLEKIDVRLEAVTNEIKLPEEFFIDGQLDPTKVEFVYLFCDEFGNVLNEET